MRILVTLGDVIRNTIQHKLHSSYVPVVAVQFDFDGSVSHWTKFRLPPTPAVVFINGRYS